MDTSTLLFAFGLTLFAGLSTGIGSAIAFFAKQTNTKFLSIALGFSAGVMIYVSFVEIMAKARIELVAELGDVSGSWLTVAAFFGGVLLIGIIDKLIPSMENPHEIKKMEDYGDNEKHKAKRLMRMGVFTALAIAAERRMDGFNPQGLANTAWAFARVNLLDEKLFMALARESERRLGELGEHVRVPSVRATHCFNATQDYIITATDSLGLAGVAPSGLGARASGSVGHVARPVGRSVC